MMKRIMACLLAAVCLLTSAAFADGLYMKVVNVKEAVNMREVPGPDGKVLTQVPVGTILTDCATDGAKQADKYVWYQVNYNGVVGYIRADKLEEVAAPAEAVAEQPVEQPAEVVAEQPAEAAAVEEPAAEPQPEATKKPKKKKKKAEATEAPAEEPATAVAEGEPLVAEGQALQPEATRAPRRVIQANVEDAPVASYADASEYLDDFVILDEIVGGVRIIGRQIYQQDREYMMAVGLDASGAELWKKETTTDHITELMQTDMFIGGTADAPLLLMYNASRGLTAINPATGEVVWEIAKRTLDLGGSISHAVDANGVAYIGGYYGPDPVAISASGELLWQSDARHDAYWLYDIQIAEGEVIATYDCIDEHEAAGRIGYGLDGSMRWVEWF